MANTSFKDIPQWEESTSLKQEISKKLNQSSFIWFLERLTSVLLVPFTLWFIVNVINCTSLFVWDRELSNGFILLVNNVFINHSFITFLMFSILLVHIRLGIHAIIEDYVHTVSSKKISYIILDALVVLTFLEVITTVLL